MSTCGRSYKGNLSLENRRGEVSEWLMVPLSKSGLRYKRSVGSNPTLSAKEAFVRPIGFRPSNVTERCWSGLSGAPGERV